MRNFCNNARIGDCQTKIDYVCQINMDESSGARFVFGKLFQEFCVMAFAKIDTQRLRFFRLNDTDVGHDYEECDDSQHCAQCCALGHCTSKNPYSRQGQCEADEGMYFPCVVCEPEYNGHPQVERLPLGAAEAVLDPSKKTKKLEPQAYDVYGCKHRVPSLFFCVEKIIGCRTIVDKFGHSQLSYHVRWKGYKSDQDTWEECEMLGDGCRAVIAKFFEDSSARNHHFIAACKNHAAEEVAQKKHSGMYDEIKAALENWRMMPSQHLYRELQNKIDKGQHYLEQKESASASKGYNQKTFNELNDYLENDFVEGKNSTS